MVTWLEKHGAGVDGARSAVSGTSPCDWKLLAMNHGGREVFTSRPDE